MVKLTNGKKTIIRSKIQYEANIKHFGMRGFKLVDDKPKQEFEDITYENETKVVPIKSKKKRRKRNEKCKKIYKISKAKS